jgi:hypothetical protein
VLGGINLEHGGVTHKGCGEVFSQRTPCPRCRLAEALGLLQ